MSESSPNPSDQLAETIVKALSDAGLIPAKRAEEIKGKLANGSAKEQDWRFWIEETLRRAEPEVNHNGQTETN